MKMREQQHRSSDSCSKRAIIRDSSVVVRVTEPSSISSNNASSTGSINTNQKEENAINNNGNGVDEARGLRRTDDAYAAIIPCSVVSSSSSTATLAPTPATTAQATATAAFVERDLLVKQEESEGGGGGGERGASPAVLALATKANSNQDEWEEVEIFTIIINNSSKSNNKNGDGARVIIKGDDSFENNNDTTLEGHNNNTDNIDEAMMKVEEILNNQVATSDATATGAAAAPPAAFVERDLLVTQVPEEEGGGGGTIRGASQPVPRGALAVLALATTANCSSGDTLITRTNDNLQQENTEDDNDDEWEEVKTFTINNNSKSNNKNKNGDAAAAAPVAAALVEQDLLVKQEQDQEAGEGGGGRSVVLAAVATANSSLGGHFTCNITNPNDNNNNNNNRDGVRVMIKGENSLENNNNTTRNDNTNIKETTTTTATIKLEDVLNNQVATTSDAKNTSSATAAARTPPAPVAFVERDLFEEQEQVPEEEDEGRGGITTGALEVSVEDLLNNQVATSDANNRKKRKRQSLVLEERGGVDPINPINKDSDKTKKKKTMEEKNSIPPLAAAVGEFIDTNESNNDSNDNSILKSTTTKKTENNDVVINQGAIIRPSARNNKHIDHHQGEGTADSGAVCCNTTKETTDHETKSSNEIQCYEENITQDGFKKKQPEEEEEEEEEEPSLARKEPKCLARSPEQDNNESILVEEELALASSSNEEEQSQKQPPVEDHQEETTRPKKQPKYPIGKTFTKEFVGYGICQGTINRYNEKTGLYSVVYENFRKNNNEEGFKEEEIDQYDIDRCVLTGGTIAVRCFPPRSQKHSLGTTVYKYFQADDDSATKLLVGTITNYVDQTGLYDIHYRDDGGDKKETVDEFDIDRQLANCPLNVVDHSATKDDVSSITLANTTTNDMALTEEFRQITDAHYTEILDIYVRHSNSAKRSCKEDYKICCFHAKTSKRRKCHCLHDLVHSIKINHVDKAIIVDYIGYVKTSLRGLNPPAHEDHCKHFDACFAFLSSHIRPARNSGRGQHFHFIGFPLMFCGLSLQNMFGYERDDRFRTVCLERFRPPSQPRKILPNISYQISPETHPHLNWRRRHQASQNGIPQSTGSVENDQFRPVVAVALRPTATSQIGLQIVDHPKGGIVIKNVLSTSIFKTSDLRAGMKIVKINGTDTLSCNLAAVANIVNNYAGYVTIVAVHEEMQQQQPQAKTGFNDNRRCRIESRKTVGQAVWGSHLGAIRKARSSCESASVGMGSSFSTSGTKTLTGTGTGHFNDTNINRSVTGAAPADSQSPDLITTDPAVATVNPGCPGTIRPEHNQETQQQQQQQQQQKQFLDDTEIRPVDVLLLQGEQAQSPANAWHGKNHRMKLQLPHIC